MSHRAVLGHVEVPVTWSPPEAVGLMQEAGIVGAGGAGFPTYLKYGNPPQTLLVNAAESEPGYYADKLLMKEEPEALVDVFEFFEEAFGIENIIIGAEDVARPYMAELEGLATKLKEFSVSYFDPKYKFGQEKALCKAVMGMDIPRDDLPHDHGVIVNNNETMFNIYRAEFEDKPVMTKFLSVYGEIGYPKVFEAPIGALAVDLLRLYGAEPQEYGDCKLYDGGPILCDLAADPTGEAPLHPVTLTTNGLLLVHPDKDRPRKKHYPDPDYEKHHNAIDAPWAPEAIQRVVPDIHRVRVPLKGKFWTTNVVAEKGQHVARGDALGEPTPGERSIGVAASIEGTVTQVTEDWVEVRE